MSSKIMRFHINKSGLIFCFVLLSVLLVGCSEQQTHRVNSVNEVLSGIDALQTDSTGGFARAHRSRSFIFPEDHLAHPEYKHEWWYFTGNLTTAAGSRLGYQLTLFRIGLVPDEKIIKTSDFLSAPTEMDPEHASNWRSNHIYMGHLSIADIEHDKFYHYEKFARATLGLAGSELVKFPDKSKQKTANKNRTAIRIWLEDWQIVSSGEKTFPLKLIAKKGDVAINLNVSPLKSPVYHGYDGLSQKGRKQGNASYYYSITRLDTNGQINIGGESFDVTGNSWFDREWSTSSLEKQQVGWDWFGLQLDDGREVMFYKMRLVDGLMDRYSSGTIVHKDGDYDVLNAEQVSIEDSSTWQSPHTGVIYPSGWKLRIPKENLELFIEPLILDQENNLTVRYWEGAVRVSGIQHNDKNKEQVSGFGYVELAGY